MIRLLIIFTLSLTLLANQLHAQEICNNNLDDDADGLVDCRDGECASKICERCDNGIDDDGDGFIDCYDKECINSDGCKGFILTNGTCDVNPEFLPIQFKLKYKSAPNLTNHVNRLVAGDIDNDGKTELVTTYTGLNGTQGNFTAITASKVNVFRPSTSAPTLDLTTSFDVNFSGTEGATYEDVLTGDIDSDGCAEIFVVSKNIKFNSNYKVYAYNCKGVMIWANPISFAFDPGMMGLADFDHDGFIELYSRTQIFDAHSGVLLGNNNIDNANTGIHAGVNKGWGMNSDAPIAVDLLPEYPGLELVAGCRIYQVIINRAAISATLNLAKEYPQYATRSARVKGNSTSVADFNQDGYLDVLAVGSDGAYDDNTTIFFWDVQNNNVKKFIDPIGTGDYIKGWKNGAGRISIADIDGDTLMNAVYVSGKYLYALKEGNTNLELVWRETVEDESSGFTGCTTFDLNGDGKSEIIYRDENYFFIYSTDETGVKHSVPVRCSSRTYNEYPIVVDVDGDGASEICLTCSTTNLINGKNLDMFDQAEVRVYESANIPWVPTRKVWNQHGYFVTNVNDNLTIPRIQQLHHLVYSENAPCRDMGSSRPFNVFMGQTPYLNESGCPAFPSPNLVPVPMSISQSIIYDAFTCVADSIQATFKFWNKGDLSANGDLQISFYNGDPKLLNSPSTRLATKTYSLSAMNPGDTITVTTKIKNPTVDFDLYVVLNDNGTTLPVDIAQQENHIIECDYDNLMQAHITPSTVTLVAELIKDNIICIADPGVPVTTEAGDGMLKSYVLVDGKKDSTNFNFYWSIGPTIKPVYDYAGYVYTNLTAGAYTVYAVHQTIDCFSDPVSILVNDVGSKPDAKIVVQKELNDTETPNGELKVIVNDVDNDGVGEAESNYTYNWYSGLQVLTGEIIGTGSSLTGLDAGTYSALVLDLTTGCYDSAYATINEFVLGTGETTVITGVSMYPNPGTEGFTVTIDNGYVGDVQLQIQSVLGNEVIHNLNSRKTTPILEIPVDTRKLKSGVYLITVTLGRGSMYTKWIKN